MPFCARRCDYCAFATWTDRSHLAADYTEACRIEVARAVEGGMPLATSVFFGGGTPSRLSADQLVGVLAAIPRAGDAEVSVECNPEDVTSDLLGAYRAGGVTRLSFGVQSMVPHVLAGLGRSHRRAAVLDAVAAAADAGFARHYSVDLIYGGAGETLADWEASLEAILALDPPPRHVSAYGLTVEAGTPLAADPARHPDADDQADKYELVDDALGAAGLGWYELSNWSAPGAECRHNLLYWRQGEYRGIGCAAHSHSLGPDGGARRWWNLRTPERYLAAVFSGAGAEAAGEDLDAATCRREALALGLRTAAGVPAGTVGSAQGLAEVLAAGLVEVAADRVVLTRRGRLLANEVTIRLLG